MDLFDFAVIGLFIIIPVLIILWFVVSLVRFIRRDKSNRISCINRKDSLLVSGVFLVVEIAFVAFIIMALNDLEHM